MLSRPKRCCCALLLLAGAALWMPAAIEAETLSIDPAHSFFMFRTVRGGVANIYGRFNDFSGSVTLDGDDFGGGSIEMSIQTASVDTGVERRDNHLRSPDFLNSAEIPVMTFKSTSVKKVSDDRFEVTGDLALHGVTKSVTASVELVGRGKDRRLNATLIGFDGTFSIQRSDFKMGFMPQFVGDEVLIHFAVQVVGQ